VPIRLNLQTERSNFVENARSIDCRRSEAESWRRDCSLFVTNPMNRGSYLWPPDAARPIPGPSPVVEMRVICRECWIHKTMTCWKY